MTQKLASHRMGLAETRRARHALVLDRNRLAADGAIQVPDENGPGTAIKHRPNGQETGFPKVDQRMTHPMLAENASHPIHRIPFADAAEVERHPRGREFHLVRRDESELGPSPGVQGCLYLQLLWPACAPGRLTPEVTDGS
jgi:hypothetical protein